MKILKLGQNLGGSNRPSGDWLPTDESSLEAWYQKEVGVTLNGSDVSAWADSSTNSHNMVQATASEQPAYSSGVLTFDGAGENLQSASDISLSGDFTIGLVLSPVTPFGTVLGDNTTAGEWLRIISASIVRIKIDNATAVDLSLDVAGWSAGYLLLTRSSNTISMWWNGVLQSDTEVLSGTADIDAIGVRKTDLNPFNGTISEVEIFSSTSAALTANVNTRLASL